MTDSIFIFGAGYSARAFAETARGRAGSILGTTRSDEKFEALRLSGISPLLFDGSELSPQLIEALRITTHLVVSIAPGDNGDPVLALIPELRQRMPRLRWIGYLSTVGVYGDHGGAWIDETAECRPNSRRSRARIDAEKAWTVAADAAGVPVALARLSGIYGPGRNAFVNLAAGTAKRLIKPGQVFNRIHVDDIAAALWHLAESELVGPFNVSDDEPAPPQDVVTYAADLMGIEPPPEELFDAAKLSPMARSFYGEVKRISNRAIKKTGYEFRFPNYRAALDAMWRDGNWRATVERPVRSAIRE
ncbi:MAG: SDR family oxidoreductase [Rhizobiaceae bacterium]|nr:SDR family oxidoreductase [Rhizobiaceae bacterium]